MAVGLIDNTQTFLNEGDALTYRFSIENGDPTAFTVRWVIIAKGALPINSADFAERAGSQVFTSTDTDYAIELRSLGDDVGGPTRQFDVAFFLVDDTDPTGQSDAPLGVAENIKIIDDDPIPSRTYVATVDTGINVITTGSLYDLPSADGGGGDDTIVISRHLFGNVDVLDGIGVNTILFDFGVTITDISETTTDLAVTTGLTLEQLITFGLLPAGSTSTIVYNRVVYSLSTGAIVTIDSPSVSTYRFQIGDGEAKSYVDIRDDFGTPTDSSPYIVTTGGELPDLSSNTSSPLTVVQLVTAAHDVVNLGGEFDVPAADGGGGDDYLIISQYLSSAISIADGIGTNIIKFDFGVVITDITETITDLAVTTGLTLEQLITFGLLPAGSTSTIVYDRVVYSLSTGAIVTIDSPSVSTYRFQIGDGEAVDYLTFRDSLKVDNPADPTGDQIDPTEANPFTVPFPTGTPTTPPTPPAGDVPDTGAYYFGWDDEGGASATDGFFQRYAVSDDGVNVGTSKAGNDLVMLDSNIDRALTTGSDVVNFLAGSDVYLIKAGLEHDVTIADGLAAEDGFNLIKLDAGVSVVSHEVITGLGGVAQLVLNLNTDADAGADMTLRINAPTDDFMYQLQDGDINTYEAFVGIL